MRWVVLIAVGCAAPEVPSGMPTSEGVPDPTTIEASPYSFNGSQFGDEGDTPCTIVRTSVETLKEPHGELGLPSDFVRAVTRESHGTYIGDAGERPMGLLEVDVGEVWHEAEGTADQVDCDGERYVVGVAFTLAADEMFEVRVQGEITAMGPDLAWVDGSEVPSGMGDEPDRPGVSFRVAGWLNEGVWGLTLAWDDGNDPFGRAELAQSLP